MDILYLLIPLSAALVFVILGVFGWAVFNGQFEDVEAEGLLSLVRGFVALNKRSPDESELMMLFETQRQTCLHY